MAVSLERANGPSLADGTLDGSLQGARLSVAIDENHHLAGIHHSSHTHGQRRLGHLVYVALEEARVGDDGVGGECLLARAAGQRRERLVEGDVAVGTDATNKQVDAACLGNHLLVVLALSIQVLCITIEDMDILLRTVDVVEEISGHERVVALGMLLGQAHIFVHVERQHVLERHATFLASLHKVAIHAYG